MRVNTHAGQMKMVRRNPKVGQQEDDDLDAGDMEGNWRVPCSLQVQASDRDTVQLDGNFGREAQVLALSSQRVLTSEDTGTVAATVSPSGMGLQAGLTRQLHQYLRGEVLWVLGPQDDAGITLNIVQTHENWSLSGKLQVQQPTAPSTSHLHPATCCPRHAVNVPLPCAILVKQCVSIQR